MIRLKKVDEMLWLNILECSGSVPRELLQLGILRVRDIIKTRRLMFLHQIMHQPKDSLLYRFLLAQARSPTHWAWTSQVLENLEDIQIEMNFNDIAEISKKDLRILCLNILKNMHSLNSLKRRTSVYLNMKEESLSNMKIQIFKNT